MLDLDDEPVAEEEDLEDALFMRIGDIGGDEWPDTI